MKSSVNPTNQIYKDVLDNIQEIEGQFNKGCDLSKEIKDTYELWQKNAMNKEVSLKLKNAMDKWKRRYGTK